MGLSTTLLEHRPLPPMTGEPQTTTPTRDQDPDFVRRAFASIADRYVLTNHVLSLGIDVLWRRRVGKIVAAGAPGWVLDVATGSGDLAQAVGRACGPDPRIVGADFCQPMLRHARTLGLPHLLVADGMTLPFADAAFDAVTIGYGLRNGLCHSIPSLLRAIVATQAALVQ